MIMRLPPIALCVFLVLCACSEDGSKDQLTDGTSVPAETSTTLLPGSTTFPRSEVATTVDPAFPIEFLSGSPLAEPSELVIVAGDSLIDIDADTVQRIGGLPEPSGEEQFWSLRAGPNAIIGCIRGCPPPDVFVLSHGESVAQPIGSGFATSGVGGVWLRRIASSETCTLTKVDWNGETLHPETEFDCGVNLVEETPLGLVAWTDANLGTIQGVLLDPSSLTTVLEVGQIHGVLGDGILFRQNDGFVLVDTETGSETEIEFPTDIGQPDYGQLSPDGSLLAVAFGHPAWPGPRQRLDVWLLNTKTLEWTRLPSMPVAAALKGTDFTWTADGRIVLYGAFDEAGVAVASYRPGDEDLQVRSLDYSPAASIVAWCTSAMCGT